MLYRLIILYFYEYCGLTVKIMSLDGTTHCLLYGKRTEKLLMLSTVMRTANKLIETVIANVKSWTMFLEGPILHSSEFFLHFANVFCTCLNF
jgi:hypothetical protein